MSNSDNRMQFPIEGTDVCPHCKSVEKIGRGYFDELEANGKVPKGSLKEGLVFQIPIVQTLTGPIMSAKPQIPVLIINYEVCGKCFVFYATKIQLVQQPVRIDLKPGQTPQFPTRMG